MLGQVLLYRKTTLLLEVWFAQRICPQTTTKLYSDPELMPATVSIFNTGGVTTADIDGGAGADGSSTSTSSSGPDGGNNNATSLATVSSSGSTSTSSTATYPSQGEEALVVVVLGSPEVDSGTGNTVFSLSAEVEVSGGSRGGDGARWRLMCVWMCVCVCVCAGIGLFFIGWRRPRTPRVDQSKRAAVFQRISYVKFCMRARSRVSCLSRKDNGGGKHCMGLRSCPLHTQLRL